MRRAAPLRFVVLVVGGWALVRVAALEGLSLRARPPLALAGAPLLPLAPDDAAPLSTVPLRLASFDAPPAIASLKMAGPAAVALPSKPARMDHALDGIPSLLAPYVGAETAAAMPAPDPPGRDASPDAPLLSLGAQALVLSQSRWSGSAWLFGRGGGDKALGPAGEIGGSQGGARVAYRLDDSGALAAFVRGYTPLGQSGAEVAGGIEWHPLRQVPFRLAVERRERVTRGGRSAWEASAAGGVDSEPIPGVLRIDAYAQAGIVGIRSRDLFADGSARAGYPARLGGGASLTVGGGVWGAAQPGAKRLDAGPQLALRAPVDHATLTIAADYRVRVAGRARPGSGPAITAAVDF
ncbi:MAG: hypothetical protein JOY99_00265 [Sphingomonadaceae bacterium]|nr:hypothetical protein [Sphingomonadaceae bacterium]